MSVANTVMMVNAFVGLGDEQHDTQYKILILWLLNARRLNINLIFFVKI